ncbi:MAG TPA: DinB family protein [Acidimicrobiales bacterium]|nr:DinB family protein [Acidimicrobiales bacterium]
MSDLILGSLRRRLRAMHSLWEEAVATMTLEQVNHVEREPVLPIAFSLFHFAQIEDGSSSMLGAGPMVYDEAWGRRIGLAITDHGKERTVAEMMGQRIGDYAAFRDYLQQVFAKTEGWLAALDPDALSEIVVPRPLPAGIASTFSARVAGEEGLSRLDAVECWIYQHGLRHMGEVEHARALVGLGGMTS